jgi:signal transduction histidine kinase
MGLPIKPALRRAANPSRTAKSSLWPRLFSRLGSSVLLAIVLAAEAGVGIFVIRDLLDSNVEVQKMYEGSVRGLRRIGELQYEAQETRRSTLYALTTNDGNLQVNYADQSREADRRVTQGISEYLAQAREPGEIKVGTRLSNDWNAYLKIRDEVLGSILENSSKEAVDLDLSAGVPLFDHVRQDLEEIKRLYEERASQQLALIAGSSRRSVIKLIAALGVGLLFGSIAIWAIQRAKMRSAVQLAKLQMEFVTSVSHELRTPITAILSAGENVRDGLVDGREGLEEQGSIITQQAAQLMDLVDQVLLFAANTKSKPWHVERPLQVSEIVGYALRNTAGLLQEAGFAVEQEIQSDLPPVVGDLSVLAYCLQNLIVNAIKYSGRERWIGLSAAMGEIPAETDEVRISVQDRGFGISDSDLIHIFEPFYRSPQVIAAQIHGTGLGLSIARRSAEAFGGRLSVVSEVGVGTVFTLHLPALKRDSDVAYEAAPAIKLGTEL